LTGRQVRDRHFSIVAGAAIGCAIVAVMLAIDGAGGGGLR
jgi:hypothetical protein